ncbi:MAG: phosphoenolpyruvate--protein phosphotransferase, partial [Candidatus Poribacteria bacterium]|nr:phosphoenolpyruvate--protein phosphotransferase [Candidatus Poribacteria bacterium]
LMPSDTIMLPRDKLLGFATEGGSRLSHVAILASALRIPAVVGIGAFVDDIESGEFALLDGTSGTLTVRPTQLQIDGFQSQVVRREELEERFSVITTEPAVMKDGERVHLFANLELPDELERIAESGVDGIGLYRTEYGYLSREDLPSEDELYQDYKRVARAFKPLPVTFRTLDLGADKALPLLRNHENLEGIEHLRSIRLCLRYPDLWIPQLRALWRAARHGDVQIMFPAIPGVTEFRAAKELALTVRDDLKREGVACADELRMGLMIELPSAVIVSDLLALEADFFSIGTNDLIPYSLGLERAYMDATMVSEPYHPSIIRSVRHVVQEASRHEIPVTVCGEIAGDPFYVLPLIGLGVRRLSMSPASAAQIKRVLRYATVGEAEAFVGSVLRLPTAQAVDYELHRYLLEHYAHLLVANVAASE